MSIAEPRPVAAVSSGLLVRKSMHVAATPERAFDVFTRRMSEWWPLDTHTISKGRTTEAVIEPRVGGRWYGRDEDGVECDWGRVLAWEPPARVVLGWEITADWRHDPKLQTEVEVRFTKDGAGTLVELEHRLLERFGDKGLEMRGVFDSEGGWSAILAKFAAFAGRVS